MKFYFLSSYRQQRTAGIKTMSLELLANELLLDIFEFLTTQEIFRAFHRLNHRFDVLLTIAFQNMGLDFRSLSKRDIKALCREYLPSVIDHTRFLRLIDVNDDQSQTDLIPFHDIALPRFRSLRSLSFFKLRRGDLLEKILIEVTQLPYLAQLNFVECHIHLQHDTRLWCIDTIWSLPQLTHCHLDLTFVNETHFTTPTSVSMSLRHLVVDGSPCHLSELAHLLDRTPCLQYLSVRISAEWDPQPPVFSPSSLTTLRLSLSNSPAWIYHFFQSVPQLSSLTVEIRGLAMDGDVWQQIISQFLPKLQRFRLKVDAQTSQDFVGLEDFFPFEHSFRSPFWVGERRWFIRTDYCRQQDEILMCLYTLPYAFSNYHTHLYSCAGFDWTSGDHSEYPHSHERVRTLHYDSKIDEHSHLYVIPFANIHHLHINLPCHVDLLSRVPNFERLLSLNITLYSSDTSLALQVLLKRATHLQSLTVTSDAKTSSMWPADSEFSVHLRCIDLLGYVPSNEMRGFNKALCREWIQSSLGRQCEIFSITVENRFNILQLLHGMVNLQTLIVNSENDFNDQSSRSDDELLDWLRVRVPLTCTIQRNPGSPSQLRVWKA